MSWESSIEYERVINQYVRAELGGAASASLLVRSYNFAEIEALQEAGRWDEAAALLSADAKKLQDAGADILVLCTNTMHKLADRIEEAIDIPFVHIADATGQAITQDGYRSVALLGTRFTMEADFYAGRLRDRYGLHVIVPQADDRITVHNVIYDELVRGIVREESRASYLAIIDRLIASGAQAVIAGCTEIELLVKPDHVTVPYYPTTRIHAETAARLALE